MKLQKDNVKRFLRQMITIKLCQWFVLFLEEHVTVALHSCTHMLYLCVVCYYSSVTLPSCLLPIISNTLNFQTKLNHLLYIDNPENFEMFSTQKRRKVYIY